jgi:sugar lactone lactonase YvrE
VTDYFHGGVLGLKPGQYILPPAETDALSIADLATAPAAERARVAKVHRRDRVYLATDVRIATLWAALYPHGTPKRGGDVYRVHPEGELEPDPDYLGDDGVSFQAPRALIISVVRTGVRRSIAERLVGEVG